MKKLKMLLLVASLAGCEAFSTETALFAVSNQNRDRVVFIVNSVERREMAPATTEKFPVEIEVAHSRYGDYGTRPSQLDKAVEVKVEFKNLRTMAIFGPAFCVAGAKLTTSVEFSAEGQVRCMDLRTYNALKQNQGGGSQ